MADYALRPARATDEEWLFAGYKQTVGPYVTATWGWNEAFQRQGFRRYHPLQAFQVIEVDQQPAGALHTEEDDAGVSIGMLFLLPAFQNRGIGSAIVRALQTQARAKGKFLDLKVIKVNPAAQLYRRLGFEVVAGDAGSQDMRWA